MQIFQQHITLQPKSRGFHLITADITRALPELKNISRGMCQVFIQHTSASLTINENADATVRKDFEMFFNKSFLKTIRITGTGQKDRTICRPT